MDQHKLRSLVFEKTGVRIDLDDPIFALVALNEAVLAEAVERHIALLDAASRELLTQSRAAAGLAAAAAPGATAAQSTPPGNGPAAVVPAAPGRPIATRSGLFQAGEPRLLAAAAGMAVLGAALTLAGQAVFFKPAPPATVVVRDRALTAEQTSALRDGEKLARAVARLDPKTRALLQSELQKP
ncbi:hypothetical protein ACFOLJ_12910 [Rugamonas sp. CCM 8940]|uniref:hypothetical protein n=1 Tax=Rugamonas sp. CCM 8940 TaxID=2765359 RepID=UPI0018F7A9BC|nr:hypothetical protein [Rugamonas sp. CCM 8940]MBJ7308894.1 hypothetical protein [Rugamonas sp. CCM 8940]